MYRTIVIILLGLAFFLVLNLGGFSLAWAQSGSTTASITGVVTDQQGAVIAGSTITAKNVQTNFIRDTKSKEDGSFVILQLPPGNYEVEVQAEGFLAKTERFNLILGNTALFNVTMKVSSNSIDVEVRANTGINEGKTESSTNNGTTRIETLPINRRNFLDFSLTSARVTVDRVPVQGSAATSGLSFNGQPTRQNNITIDGLDNNDFGSGSVRSTFSQDAVQEFQVISDSYSAEIGRALGGVVNIVTKRGDNQYQGSVFFFNRNDKISARKAFETFKPDFRQYQFGSLFSGPIIKDKVFFFTSFERLSVKQNNIVTISDDIVQAARRQGFSLSNGPIPFSLGTTSVLTRIDAQLTPNDSLYFRYSFGGDYNGTFDPFGGQVGETFAGVRRLDDNSIAINNTYINTKLNLVNETRFLYSRRNQIVSSLEDGPQLRLSTPSGRVLFGRNTFTPQPRAEGIYQIIDNVSLVRGHNQIKFGGDFNYINSPGNKTSLPILAGGFALFAPLDFTALTGIPGLPFFTELQSFDPASRTSTQLTFLTALSALLPSAAPGFPRNVPLAQLALPTAYAQGFGDTRLEVPIKLFSFFVQDDIKLKQNLLLKLGIRYDINRIRFVPANRGNFSPRVAISFRPTKISNLDLHAAYGIFFGAAPLGGTTFTTQTTTSGKLKIPVIPFPFSVLPFSLPNHHFPESDQLPSSVNFIPQLSQIFQYQPNLRNSYSQQLSAGFNYFLDGNTAIALDYVYIRGIKLLGGRNINPIVRPIAGNTLGSAISGRVNTSQGDITEYESSFDSYYHGVTLSITRQFTNKIGFLASYTYSKGIDNLFDIIISAVDGPVNPLRPGDERGLSIQDVKSRFVLSGVWNLDYTKKQLLKDFQLSTIVTVESGRPYNVLAGVDLNMNGDSGGDRPLGLGRNVGISPGFANIDMRLTRTFVIKDRYRLQGFVEVFNLFNHVNISDFNRVFPPDAQSNFNLPPMQDGRYIVTPDRYRDAFAPRQFQLGFRVAF